MNYDVSRDSLSARNLVFEGCHEIPVDLDFSLPDYCPDIQRILKCVICPNISSRNISGDRLNIEGGAKIKVLYLDSDHMKIRCCENSVPFSCSVDIKSAPENAVAITNSKTEYVNCRAVSPRKLDIHGAFSVCAEIYNKKTFNVSSCVEGKDIQQKTDKIKVNNLIAMGQQRFSLNESLEPGNNRPSPESIIRSDVFALVKEYKNMANKSVVKGEVFLKILYIDDLATGHTETMEYSLPVSQIVDVPGLTENSTCVISAQVLSHEEEISSQNEESSNIIETEIKPVITVMGYEEKEVSVVTDVYSTEYNLDVVSETVNINQPQSIMHENFTHKTTINLGETNISKIIDAWSDPPCVTCGVSEDKLVFKGKMNLCILATDSQEVPVYTERMIEFEYFKSKDDIPENFACEAKAVPVSISYGVAGENMEFKINFDLSFAVYSCEKYSMVSEASADESHIVDKDPACLTVYYASQGENIWDIARRYYTCADMIKRENDLSEDTVKKDRMLLIPMK